MNPNAFVLIVFFSSTANDAGVAVTAHTFQTETACRLAANVINTDDRLQRRFARAFCFHEGDWRKIGSISAAQ